MSKEFQSKSEGWFGWLSYVGWTLTIIFPLILFISIDDLTLPILKLDISLISFGLILSTITIFKSTYPISHNRQKILLFLFILAIFIVVIDMLNMVSETKLLLYSILWLWIFLLLWYSLYFYEKSKDGYRHIWLKILLITLVLTMSLFVLFYGFFTPPCYDCGECSGDGPCILG